MLGIVARVSKQPTEQELAAFESDVEQAVLEVAERHGFQSPSFIGGQAKAPDVSAEVDALSEALVNLKARLA